MSVNVGLGSILKFGKYEGEQIEDVLEDNPEYLAYIAEEGYVQFDEEVLQELTKRGYL